MDGFNLTLLASLAAAEMMEVPGGGWSHLVKADNGSKFEGGSFRWALSM
jgi:hypothetical protein